MQSSGKYFEGPTTCLALYESTSERCTEEEKLAKETAEFRNFGRGCDSKGEGSVGVVYNSLFFSYL